MRWQNIASLAIAAALGLATTSLWAQGPGGPGGQGGPGGPGGQRGGNQQRGGAPDEMLARLMKLDADQDGQLSKAEVTDRRLLRLFTAADANKDDVVTADELKTHFASQVSNARGQQGGQGGPGMGQGGPGMGPGGMMGPPRIGEVMPSFLQQMLKLTPQQQAQMAALQQKVNAELANILTDEQEEQCAQMMQGVPGGQRGGQSPDGQQGGPRGERGPRGQGGGQSGPRGQGGQGGNR
ncbi:hypothetical protein [Blastopirellula marina]|uniref:EF-hand domain-containing protein n=1 Tax=Blastopirellula marina DSM 3645 TaxID=314230 RepID=A3ZXW9_9BACT|nr:hypothetical protein [Blastopirellula marina]EAQ78678.1 hypothetical protein DSM3645_07795 [Blastopirellula marina DSM 3645]